MRTRRRAVRTLVAATTAWWLAACGASIPDSPSATPEPHLACATGRSAEEMFTSEPRAGWFTLRAPRLPGWDQRQLEGSAPGFVLHRFDLTDGDLGSAIITITAFSPTATADAALVNLRTLRASGLDWQETSSESIEICGGRGLKVSGNNPAAGTDMHHDFLEFAYTSAGLIYPIQVRSQLRAAAATRYAADLRTIFDGIRIGP